MEKKRNLWVIPTDKPSRLVLDSINNNLFLTTTKSFPSDIMKFKNIYITSDEEIKDDDWYLDTFNTQRIKANQFSDHKHYGSSCKKNYPNNRPRFNQRWCSEY